MMAPMTARPPMTPPTMAAMGTELWWLTGAGELTMAPPVVDDLEPEAVAVPEALALEKGPFCESEPLAMLRLFDGAFSPS